MSILDRVLKRGRAPQAEAKSKVTMNEEEARQKRIELWNELRANPSPERAAQIAREATALLDVFGRQHPLYGNINDLIQAAERAAGHERLFAGE